MKETEYQDQNKKKEKPEFSPPEIESQDIMVQDALGSCAPPVRSQGVVL